MLYFDVSVWGCTYVSHVSFDPDVWDVPRGLVALTLSLSFPCTILCTLRGLIIYIIYFSPFTFPCDHCVVIYFSAVIFTLFVPCACYFLSLTETVKQAYGQWLLYGEFNTLEFISRYCSWYMNFGGVTGRDITVMLEKG